MLIIPLIHDNIKIQFETILILFFLLFKVYESHLGLWCNTQEVVEQNTILKAKRECSKGRYRMFYDYKSEGNKFVLCGAEATIKPSWFNSTIYIKGVFCGRLCPFTL